MTKRPKRRKGTSANSETFLQRAVRALTLASPFVLARRFDDGFAHCIEASVCGAAALVRELNIQARAIPCAIVGTNLVTGSSLFVGLTEREAYDTLKRIVPRLPPFEDWRVSSISSPTDDCPTHMVIETKHNRERAVVDLTLGQVRAPYGVDVPLHVAWFGDGWRDYDFGAWKIRYIDSPRPDAVNVMASTYEINPGFVNDFRCLIDVAVHCKLDEVAFHQTLQFQQTEHFDKAMAIIKRFATTGATS